MPQQINFNDTVILKGDHRGQQWKDLADNERLHLMRSGEVVIPWDSQARRPSAATARLFEAVQGGCKRSNNNKNQ